jgi:hypothetical protein
MILLTTPLAKAQHCARVLQEATNETVHVTASLHAAITQLQNNEYSAVLMDQSLLDSGPRDSDMILKHLGSAVPVYCNFAVCGIDRASRELRSALARRKRELQLSRQEAEQILRRELKDTITALLLSCEMALNVPNLPLFAETKMREADALAKDLRTKLG